MFYGLFQHAAPDKLPDSHRLFMGLDSHYDYQVWPTNRIAALLLVPYIVWVAFAAYLNYSI
jgi:hypothetical protein